MNKELILEVGKTYVFKDDECRKAYLANNYQNYMITENHYHDGFKIQCIDDDGDAIINGIIVISLSDGERNLFKLKETPSNTASEALPEDLPIVEYNELNSKVHSLSERYKLYYSYCPSENNYLVDYKELCYKITSLGDLEKLEQMVAISEELLQC